LTTNTSYKGATATQAVSDKSVLTGSLPVIPTPFLNGKIDYDSLLRLFDHLFPELEGYTIGGSTGEAVSMTIAERTELIRFAAKNTPAGKTIVVGLTHTDLLESQELLRVASDAGVHAGLVPSPYYFPNSFEMVREYMRALAGAGDLPLVFYDNPVTTKTAFSAAQLLELAAACPTIKAIKMTDHALEKITALRLGGMSVFAGDDVVAFRSLLLGVKGSMIIAPAVFPAAYQQTLAELAAGDEMSALETFSRRVLPFIHLFGIGDEIAVTKGLYEHLGIFRSGELRLPLLASTKERLSHAILAYEFCMR